MHTIDPDLRRTRRASRLAMALAWAVLVVLVCGVLEAEACPTCKDGIGATDPDGQNVARGYFYSILLMLAMPFTLAGSFGCYVWREMRRQRLAEEGRQQAATGGVAATTAFDREASLP